LCIEYLFLKLGIAVIGGAVSVIFMKHFRAPRFQITLEEGQIKKDVQLLRTGTFKDERYGTLQVTSSTLLSMKKNWDDKVRGVDLSIDYKHESDDIAAGWIKEVYLKENNTELWAVVDWTPKGQKVLSDKEFRYLSADFNFDYQDNESLQKFGPTLFGAGLTNRPVVKRMEPAIELEELTEKGRQEMKIVEDLQAQLKELQEKNKKLSDEVTAAQAAAAGDKSLGDGALPPEVQKEIEDLKAKIAALTAENTKFAAESAELKNKAQLSEKEVKFQKLLSEGKVVPAQKDAYIKDDMVKFAELSGAVNLSAKGTPENPPASATGNVDDQIMELANKKLSEDTSLDLRKAVSLVLQEKPELAKQRSN
jgi:FtsZ-binding cell division protein ZapB